MSSKLILGILSIYSIIFSFLVYAQPFGGSLYGGSLDAPETQPLTFYITQWVTIATGIVVIVSGAFAVSSLIFPGKFFNNTVRKYSWIGLISSTTLSIFMSFFGDSILKYMTNIYQCGLAIIGLTCS